MRHQRRVGDDKLLLEHKQEIEHIFRFDARSGEVKRRLVVACSGHQGHGDGHFFVLHLGHLVEKNLNGLDGGVVDEVLA